MPTSKAHGIAKLVGRNGLVRNDVVTTFDSDQVVSIVGENLPVDQTGFDSDQVVAIIGENTTTVTGGNAITVTSGVVNHDDTSTQASVNNSGSNFIQDIILDTYGHITAITSAAAAGGDPYVNVNSTATAATASGTDGIAVGGLTYALGGNTISIGRQAGQYTTTLTDQSIHIGTQAGQSSNAGNEICIGSNSGAHGYLNTNTYLRRNSVNIGAYAGRFSGNGHEVSIGHQAGASDNQDAYNIGRHNNTEANVNIGYQAGYKSVNTYENVRIGPNSGANYGSSTITYTNSYGNVYVGSNSGQHGASQTNVNNNVTIGRSAGAGRTNGYQNIMIGALSGQSSQGYQCTYIGSNTTTSSTSTAINGETVLGYGLTGKGSQTLYTLGAPYNSYNNSSWYTSSDERIKTNVTEYTLGLDTLGQVNVKTYNYLSDSDIATAHPELADSDGLVHEGLDTEKTIVGIMAQELEVVLPNSVTTRDNGIKAVNKDELFWVMLNSIKELKARVEALENA